MALRARSSTREGRDGAGAIRLGSNAFAALCCQPQSSGDDYLHARARLALGSASFTRCAPMEKRRLRCTRRSRWRQGRRERDRRNRPSRAWVRDVQAGRRERADAWLAQAAEEAADWMRTGIDRGRRGMNLSDAASYEEALSPSRNRSSAQADASTAAKSPSLWRSPGAVHVLTGRHQQAREALERSLELVRRRSGSRFAPPEAMLAHVDLREGRVDQAGATA